MLSFPWWRWSTPLARVEIEAGILEITPNPYRKDNEKEKLGQIGNLVKEEGSEAEYTHLP